MSVPRVLPRALYGFFCHAANNQTRGLRGCMIMQSTTWPCRIEANGCPHKTPLLLKRTWRIGKVVVFGLIQSQQLEGTPFSSVARTPSIKSCRLSHRALKIRTPGISYPEQVTSTQKRPVDRGVSCIPLFHLGPAIPSKDCLHFRQASSTTSSDRVQKFDDSRHC